tara:strand:- start:1884 stop:2135 length:252 start_codon:yes stop_codon:yes gene_type:complete
LDEYQKRLEDPCWQRHQELISVFLLDSHNTSYFWKREDNTYYWQHSRKRLDDDLFVDADGVQLDLFGKPDLTKQFIMDAILDV